MQKAVTLDPETTRHLGALGYAHALRGQSADALKVLDQLRGRAKEGFVDPADMALVYIGLGDKDKAFERLEKAFEARSGLLSYLKSEPMFDSLRTDPRFTALLKKSGLQP